MTILAQKIVVPDKPIRLTSANSFNGTAAKRGTATDLLLTIIVEADGTSGFGTTAGYVVQGSNDGSTWTPVTPDKGAFTSDSAANSQVAHFGQLQFAQWRCQPVGATGLVDFTAVYNFQTMADSFDATIQ